MALKIIDRIQGVQTTTDAVTTTTVVQYPTPNNAAYYIEAVLVGRDTSNGDSVTTRIGGRFNRISGTLAIVGTTLSLLVLGGSAALTTATASVDASGDNIRIRVNGVIGKTIEWYSDMQIWVN